VILKDETASMFQQDPGAAKPGVVRARASNEAKNQREIF
jgi:hypothetical protein